MQTSAICTNIYITVLVYIIPSIQQIIRINRHLFTFSESMPFFSKLFRTPKTKLLPFDFADWRVGKSRPPKNQHGQQQKKLIIKRKGLFQTIILRVHLKKIQRYSRWFQGNETNSCSFIAKFKKRLSSWWLNHPNWTYNSHWASSLPLLWKSLWNHQYIDIIYSPNGEFVWIYHDRKHATTVNNSKIRCQ